MSDRRYDRRFWEDRWTTALREHAAQVATRPPHAHLVAALADAPPGRALDAGCGHGAEALWLAARGWEVTAVDFAASALDHARATAERLGARGITWVEADLVSWTPPPDAFDLVISLYVHSDGPVTGQIQRLARGVAPGGALFLVGHRPIDPRTGAPTPAAGQNQVSVEAARAALDLAAWELRVAEDRPREVAGSGVDAVVFAIRGEARRIIRES